MMRGKLLTLTEVRQILRFSRSKLYAERRAGRLRVLRFNRVIRVSEKELSRYLERAARGTR
jgi:hypothetical protein